MIRVTTMCISKQITMHSCKKHPNQDSIIFCSHPVGNHMGDMGSFQKNTSKHFLLKSPFPLDNTTVLFNFKICHLFQIVKIHSFMC